MGKTVLFTRSYAQILTAEIAKITEKNSLVFYALYTFFVINLPCRIRSGQIY